MALFCAASTLQSETRVMRSKRTDRMGIPPARNGGSRSERVSSNVRRLPVKMKELAQGPRHSPCHAERSNGDRRAIPIAKSKHPYLLLKSLRLIQSSACDAESADGLSGRRFSGQRISNAYDHQHHSLDRAGFHKVADRLRQRMGHFVAFGCEQNSRRGPQVFIQNHPRAQVANVNRSHLRASAAELEVVKRRYHLRIVMRRILRQRCQRLL